MTEADFMRGMAALVLHASAYNIPCDDKALAVSYRDAIKDIPGDLFVSAIRATLSDWTDSFRLPMPAIIRAKIEEDMRLRRAVLYRLRQRDQTPEDEGPFIDPAEARRLCAEAIANLTAKSKSAGMR